MIAEFSNHNSLLSKLVSIPKAVASEIVGIYRKHKTRHKNSPSLELDKCEFVMYCVYGLDHTPTPSCRETLPPFIIKTLQCGNLAETDFLFLASMS